MKKKIIIISLTLLILLIVLFFPMEVISSMDGGSTTIYKSLISETIAYSRPPIGAKTYKKGKIISILGREIYNNVIVLDNPNYVDYTYYNSLFSNFVGHNKTALDVSALIDNVNQFNQHPGVYDNEKINLVDSNGNRIEKDSINASKRYLINIKTPKYTFYPDSLKTIIITEMDDGNQ